MDNRITIRPATPADAPLLFALFAEEKTSELAPLGLRDEQLRPLLEMQYRGRRMTYAGRYPKAAEQVICREDGAFVGRLLLDRNLDHWRIVDICVLAAYRGQGAGGAAIAECRRKCGHLGIPLRLSVATANPARRLYERMGFAHVSEDAISVGMEWSPDPPPGECRSSASAETEEIG